jgi:predicted DNA-binding transcriptional regulator AlpA
MEPQSTSLRALRLPQVIDKVGISRSQVSKMTKSGEFPASHDLSRSGCIKAWSEAEIDTWLEAKFEGQSIAEDALPKPIGLLGHNGGPPLDEAITVEVGHND